MDIVDNLIYAAGNDYTAAAGAPRARVDGEFTFAPASWDRLNAPYSQNTRLEFTHFTDPAVIDKAIQKHWFDVAGRLNIEVFNADPAIRSYDFSGSVPYHLIFAYLIENTRIVQIFERVITQYQQDEKLAIVNSSSLPNASQWLANTEDLFYKEMKLGTYRNIAGQLRGQEEGSRRNAYMRMFGMDLAFGDHSRNNLPYEYAKPKSFNSSFVPLFEYFLREIWQAYTNAKNTSGANTTDYDHITELADQLADMLMARRTSDSNFNSYRYFNLSREEYSSVVMTSWLFFAIQSDTPIIEHLKCEANTAYERLAKVATRVGLPSHSKSKSLIDLAAPMGALLRTIEERFYSNSANVRNTVESYASGVGTAQAQAALDQLLVIVNSWEKATDHKIKNPDLTVASSSRK